nr:MBL fold metallo-hydrolase [Peribacillus kribbensis]
MDLGGKTLIFDTLNSQSAASDLAEAALKTTGRPASYVINSHWHGDHIRGNQCFKGAVIFSSLATRNKMLEIHPERISDQQASIPQLRKHIKKLETDLARESNPEKKKKVNIQLNFLKEIEKSLPGLEFTLPDLTFEHKMVFTGNSRQAVLQTMGGGHTLCDSFLYLPEEEILFAGDLLFSGTHPNIKDGNPINWLGILQNIKQLSAKVLVPGHGPVSDESAITGMECYLTSLLEMADALHNVEETQIPLRFEAWEAPELFSQNLLFLSQQTFPKNL